ncbi:CBO0543 family protein [Halalkalibacter kiskunsagensis]|uniref:CBO0543 family protein n=1 Tax=Halalkalibacter kiskunsagensis TaxID=1548599 RepID=A0ABV6KAI6_9BACI
MLKSNKSSFTFEYFAFPVITVFFNLYYPKKNKFFIKFLYYFFYLSLLTGLEFIAVKYTKTIKYICWKWYWSTITMGISIFISRLYFKWFFINEIKPNSSTSSSPLDK